MIKLWRYPSVVLLLVLFVGLLAVSYTASLAFVLGLIVAWFVRFDYQVFCWKWAMLAASSFCIMSLYVGSLWLSSVSCFAVGEGWNYSWPQTYEVTVEPTSLSFERFTVSEEITFTSWQSNGPVHPITLVPPAREVHSSRQGLFLKSVTIPLPEGNVDTTFPDGTSLRGLLRGIS